MTVTPLATKNNKPVLSGTVSSLSPTVGIAAVQVLVGNQTLLATVTGNAWHVRRPLRCRRHVRRAGDGHRRGGEHDHRRHDQRVDRGHGGPGRTVTPLVTNNNKPTLTGTVSDPSPGSAIAA